MSISGPCESIEPVLRRSRLSRWWGKVQPVAGTAARKVTQTIMRVAAKGATRARQAGQFAARKVLAMERTAVLPERLVNARAGRH